MILTNLVIIALSLVARTAKAHVRGSTDEMESPIEDVSVSKHHRALPVSTVTVACKFKCIPEGGKETCDVEVKGVGNQLHEMNFHWEAMDKDLLFHDKLDGGHKKNLVAHGTPLTVNFGVDLSCINDEIVGIKGKSGESEVEFYVSTTEGILFNQLKSKVVSVECCDGPSSAPTVAPTMVSYSPAYTPTSPSYWPAAYPFYAPTSPSFWPVQYPMASPVYSPVAPPVPSPVVSPVYSPAASPVTSPVVSPAVVSAFPSAPSPVPSAPSPIQSPVGTADPSAPVQSPVTSPVPSHV